jgi:molybdopterin molybdotransferase
VLELAEARDRILAAVHPLPAERIPIHDAFDRYLAEDVCAGTALPPFDNSAMDGYAVRAEDVRTVGASNPVRLKLLGAVPAGCVFSGAVEEGTCVRVFTGSPLPQGADAVVMQEDTRPVGDSVEVLDVAKPWENVRLAGEDVKAGSVVAHAGEPVTAARLALLGAVGLSFIQVHRTPKVSLLGTGSELIEPGKPLAPGKIYESNRLMLAALIRRLGFAAHVAPIATDELGATRAALEEAFRLGDVVVTTGGVSVGEHDLVKAAFEQLGGRLEFWRIAVKPGKPFVFGRLGEKFLFGLPGNPVSAFVTFLLLARPALLRIAGARDVELPTTSATLGEPLQNRGDRTHFVRVFIDANSTVRAAGLQASHALSSLAACNGLLEMPPNTNWENGKAVRVIRLD